MAQDGGGVPTARVATATQGVRPPAARGLPRRDVITLAQPRPGVARKQNEYIETPLRPQLPASKASKSRLKDEPATALDLASRTPRPAGFHEESRSLHRTGVLLPVTAQPAVAIFKKEKLPDTLSNVSDDQHQDSIICRQCRRCKCEACRNPRHLPSKWICNDKFLCSASSVVDYCTCMCCVKCLFYHWGKDYETDSEVSCADQPCACSPHKRILRWGCLSLLSLALPCLLCYWPLKGCMKACETCYTRCAAQGCRCAPHHRTPVQPTEAAPEKRLLDTNSDC